MGGGGTFQRKHLQTLLLTSNCVVDCISFLFPPFQHPVLLRCRTDRKIHDKNGQITALEERLAELGGELDQERKEVVNLREGLRLRQESLEVQQQRQQVGGEGMCGWGEVARDVWVGRGGKGWVGGGEMVKGCVGGGEEVVSDVWVGGEVARDV